MRVFLALMFLVLAGVTRAADSGSDTFTGHYSLAKNPKSAFALDVLQKGKTATTSFSAANDDGSGAAPDGDGEGTLTAKGELAFKWTDTFDNAGTAILRRDGKLFHLSIKVTKAAEPRALKFYGDVTLKRTSMKPEMSTR